MRNISKIGRLLLLMPMLALAGCSGEPDESDMREAVERQLKQANDAVAGLSSMLVGRKSPDMKTTLHEFKKLDCAKADGSTAYTCSFTMQVKGPLGENSMTTEARFIEAESGWVLE